MTNLWFKKIPHWHNLLWKTNLFLSTEYILTSYQFFLDIVCMCKKADFKGINVLNVYLQSRQLRSNLKKKYEVQFDLREIWRQLGQYSWYIELCFLHNLLFCDNMHLFHKQIISLRFKHIAFTVFVSIDWRNCKLCVS